MHIATLNIAGLVMMLVALAVPCIFEKLTGSQLGLGKEMIAAGLLSTIFDLIYRSRQADRSWFRLDRGGGAIHIPIWIIGIFWLALGVVYINLAKLNGTVVFTVYMFICLGSVLAWLIYQAVMKKRQAKL